MQVKVITFNGNPKMTARCVTHGTSMYVHTADLHHLFGSVVKKAVKREIDSISRVMLKHDTFVDIRVAAHVALRLFPVPTPPIQTRWALSVLGALKDPSRREVVSTRELPWDIRPGRVKSKVNLDGTVSVRGKKNDA